jgi:phosphatidate cytidylyltransferase
MNEDVVTPKPRSDLGVRTASGIVMMLIFAGAIAIGGWPFTTFVAILIIGLLYEWLRLVRGFAQEWFELAMWVIVGGIYIVFAARTLINIRDDSLALAVFPIAVVIATDIGAYFAGRTFGGPKIAPKISPSKTWSGLVGGMTAAGAVSAVSTEWLVLDQSYQLALMGIFVAVGAVLAIFAQMGDFLESWMKRRAGVKDSGQLIPGHGGLLDRMDGLLAVLCVFGLFISFAGPSV